LAANCSACASGCTGGVYGKVLRSSPPACTGAFANWTLWLDTLGVEQGNHSCIAYYPTEQVTFTAARVACGAISPAAHMLTTRQVGGPDAGHRLELLHCTLRLHVCLLVCDPVVVVPPCRPWTWCLVVVQTLCRPRGSW
jgi:hypothetical protein